MEKRVVITGLGTINPLGQTVPEFWENLAAGKNGVRMIRNIDVSDFGVRIGGEVDLPDTTTIFKNKKLGRRLSRFILFGQIAGSQAVLDSGLDIEKAPHRVGAVIGTGDAGLEAHYINIGRIYNHGMDSVSPYYVSSAVPNTVSGLFCQQWGIKGVSMSVATACASSNHAIGTAAMMIRAGMADAIFAGGSESQINRAAMAAFGIINSLSVRNDSPETASRPFDKNRDGFVMGEGAGVLCLEEREHAKARGANIYGEITGFGFSSDAYDLVAPHPEGDGAVQAMNGALEMAGINRDQIDLINGHATSTTAGDLAEAKAIQRVFGGRATQVPVQCTKSLTGHLIGGSGAVEAIAAILALNKGIIHPTLNLFEKDPEIDLNILTETTERKGIQHVLSNNFAFCGQNACLVISKYR